MMTTPTLPAVAELRADEGLLRQTIGAVLEPGPYLHDCLWIISPKSHHANGPCRRCGVTPDKPSDYCSIPGPYDDELEVAAERLVKMFAVPSCDGLKLWSAIGRFYDRKEDGRTGGNSSDDLMWFILWSTPTDRCLCALLALGRARME